MRVFRYRSRTFSKYKYIIRFDSIFTGKTKIEGTELNFMDWFNEILVPDYNSNNTSTYANLTTKNYKSILTILKSYLKEINIEIDYESDSKNVAKYKTFQFVIKPSIDLKMITKPKLNPYYACNPVIETTDSNSTVIQYTHNFQSIINKNPITKSITFLYKNEDETRIINETLIIRPIKKLRKQFDNSYLDYEKKFKMFDTIFPINNKVYRYDITIPNENKKKPIEELGGQVEPCAYKRYIYTTNKDYNSDARRSVSNVAYRQRGAIPPDSSNDSPPDYKLPYLDSIINYNMPPCVIIKDKAEYHANYLTNLVEVFNSTKNNTILNTIS